MSPGQRQLIAGLIGSYAQDSGTETLISAVADTSGLLDACRNLFDIDGRVESSLADWLRRECFEHGVGERQFVRAVSQVLAIFNAESTGNDHYAVLGIAAGADRDEIKSAYRRLSLRYHPDRAKHNGDYDPERFVRINKAYHALIQPGRDAADEEKARGGPVWSRTRRKGLSSRRKKKLFYWSVAAVALLVVVSAVGSLSVRKRAMLAGLTEERSAFIPPVQRDEGESSERGGRPGEIPDSAADFHGRLEETEPAVEQERTRPEPVREETRPEADRSEAAEQKSEKAVAAEVAADSPPPASAAAPDELDSGADGVQEAVAEAEPAADVSAAAGDVEAITTEDETVATASHPYVAVETQPPLTAAATDHGMGPGEAALPAEVDRAAETGDQDQPMSLETAPRTAAVGETGDLDQPMSLETAPRTASVRETVDRGRPQREELRRQQSIDEFVVDYQQAYAARDIEKFSGFFAEDAMENGKLFAERIAVYDKLFKTTRAIALNISVLSWQDEGSEILVDGRFTVSLDYRYSRDRAGAGTIALVLEDRGGALRISSLDYSFDGE